MALPLPLAARFDLAKRISGRDGLIFGNENDLLLVHRVVPKGGRFMMKQGPKVIGLCPKRWVAVGRVVAVRFGRLMKRDFGLLFEIRGKQMEP